MESYSSEEAHVGTTHAFVRVAHTGEHPLSPSLTTSVCREEVEEDRRVQRANRLLTEVVVVGINLMAAPVVGAPSCSLDESRVGL